MRPLIYALAPILSVALTAVPGCNQPDPPSDDDGEDSGADDDESGDDDTSGTDDDIGPAGSKDSHYPLVDGATWVYRHQTGTETSWEELVEMSAVEHEGADAFEVADNEDPAGERTFSTLMVDGSLVTRVYKEVTQGEAVILRVDYDPGFPRYDEAWIEEGESYVATYQRSELDVDGSVLASEERQQVYLIESLSTMVDVPAGTFDCVQVLRTRPDNNQQTRQWFAKGVGKIKDVELEDGSVEELMEYDIP